MSLSENLPPKVIRRVMKEIKKVRKEPPDGVELHINENEFASVTADITGPVGTPFEGGVFRCKLCFGPDFPEAPPKGLFLTKIFHPNVSKNGDICVDTLKKDWKNTYGLDHVLAVIRCLLIFPNPASALNEEAGKMLLEDYDGYAKRATLWTQIHARKRSSKESEKKERTNSSGATTTKTVSTAPVGGKQINKLKQKKKKVLKRAKAKAKKRL